MKFVSSIVLLLVSLSVSAVDPNNYVIGTMKPGEHQGGYAFNQDGTMLAFCTRDLIVLKKFDVALPLTVSDSIVLTSDYGNKSELHFSKDGTKLYFRNIDPDMSGSFQEWNLITREKSHAIPFKGLIRASYSEDGSMVALAGKDEVRIYNLTTMEMLKSIKLKGNEGVVFHPDNKRVLAWAGGVMYVFIASTGECLSTYITKDKIIYDCCISPDGEHFASVTKSEIDYWNFIQTKTVNVMPITWTGGYWPSIEFVVGDNSSIIFCTADDAMRIYDLNAKTVKMEIGAGSSTFSVHPSGLNVLMRGDQNKLNFVNLTGVVHHTYIIDHLVASEFSVWEKRGEFEKSDDYATRMSESGKEKHKQEVTDYAIYIIAKYVGDGIDTKAIELLPYDPDAERYEIRMLDGTVYNLDVPIAEAPGLKLRWSSVEYVDFQYGFGPNPTNSSEPAVVVTGMKILDSEPDNLYVARIKE